MRFPSRVSAAAGALLGLFLFAQCTVPEFEFLGGGTGGADSGPDGAGGAGLGAGGGGGAGTGGEGGEAGTGGEGQGGAGGTGGAPGKCTSDEECPLSSNIAEGRCDVPSGKCVCLGDEDCVLATKKKCDAANGVCKECLADADCPSDKYCLPTGVCRPGCRTGPDTICVPPQECDPAPSERVCSLPCTEDDDCPLGEICNGQYCKAGCNATHGCQNPLPLMDCCDGNCEPLLISTSTKHCGACGNACTVTSEQVNAEPKCSPAGQCTFGCIGFNKDCNGDASDGCETNLSTDPNNCSDCGKRCEPGQTCVARKCVDP
jgi:hypothetical protein